MSGITFTCAHSRFMAAQILLLFIGFPVRVRKITPLCSPMTCTYWRSSFCNPLGIRMLRVLFLQEMETSPRRTASTVKYCSSDTRIPVAQSVCSSSHRRRSCFAAFRVGVIRPSSRKPCGTRAWLRLHKFAVIYEKTPEALQDNASGGVRSSSQIVVCIQNYV